MTNRLNQLKPDVLCPCGSQTSQKECRSGELLDCALMQARILSKPCFACCTGVPRLGANPLAVKQKNGIFL